MFKAGSITSDLGIDARPMTQGLSIAGKAAQTFAQTMDKEVSTAVQAVEQIARTATKQLQAMAGAGIAAVRAFGGGGAAIPVAKIAAVNTGGVAAAVQPVIGALERAQEASGRFANEHTRGMLQAQAITRAFGPTVANFIADPLLGVIAIGNRALGLIGQLIAKMTGGGLNLAADFEQAKVAMTTMLGSADKAEAFLAKLEEFGKKTPFTFGEALQVSRSLMAAGFSDQDILPNLKMVGDVAAVIGKEKLPQIAYAYGQVRTQGKLAGQEMLQFLNAGVPLYDALSKHLGVNTAEVKRMVDAGNVGFADVQAAFRAMTSEGGIAFDGMAKLQNTLTGSFSNVVDAVERVMRAFGAGFAEGAKLTQGMNDLSVAIGGLESIAESAGKIFGETIAPAMKFVADHAKEVAIAVLVASTVLGAGGLVGIAMAARTALKGLGAMHQVAAQAAKQNATAQTTAASAMSNVGSAAKKAGGGWGGRAVRGVVGAGLVGAGAYAASAVAEGKPFESTVSGAGTGAMFGSMLGPKGALAGAAIGGLIGVFRDLFRAMEPKQMKDAANGFASELNPAIRLSEEATKELAKTLREAGYQASDTAAAIAGMARGDSDSFRSDPKAAGGVHFHDGSMPINIEIDAAAMAELMAGRIQDKIGFELRGRMIELENEIDRRVVGGTL